MARRRLSRSERKQMLVQEAKILQDALSLEWSAATRDLRLLRRKTRLAEAGLRLVRRMWRFFRRRTNPAPSR